VLEQLDRDMEQVYTTSTDAIDRAGKGLIEIRRRWDLRKKQVQEAYEKILRDLQKAKIDGEAFIRLRRQIEGLRPLKEQKTSMHRRDSAYAGPTGEMKSTRCNFSTNMRSNTSALQIAFLLF